MTRSEMLLAERELEEMTNRARESLFSAVKVADLSGRYELAHLIRTTLVALDDVRNELKGVKDEEPKGEVVYDRDRDRIVRGASSGSGDARSRSSLDDVDGGGGYGEPIGNSRSGPTAAVSTAMDILWAAKRDVREDWG